ncbi:hypothetical protein HRbin35_00433 [bacterium HR35]|nr:hypothetical protein HRbin35_00433 [bacterium HR35]
MKKGFTYTEIVIVLFLLIVIGGIILSVIRVQSYFARSRDLKRISDLESLTNVLRIYSQSTSTPDLDGPYLDYRGIDEVWPTVFISVPLEFQSFPSSSCVYGNKIFAVFQTDKNNYLRIDGHGWLPVDFTNLTSLPFSSLPVDPLNNYSRGYYYLYAFRRKPLQFELSAALESKDFKQGGREDKTSTDNGNDPNRFEIGTNLDLIPPFPPPNP